MADDNMKLAFAIKGGIEAPREPFDDNQMQPTFVSVTTEYGATKFQVIPLNPCKPESFDGIDDISVLKYNGY